MTIQKTFSYEDTAYHPLISYALTGIPVHDRNTLLDVFFRTKDNSLVASEIILAKKTAQDGKEESRYTDFIGDTIFRMIPEWRLRILLQQRSHRFPEIVLHGLLCRSLQKRSVHL